MPPKTHIPNTTHPLSHKRTHTWATSLLFALVIHGLLGWIPLSMHTPPPPPPPLRIKIVARPKPPPPPPPRPITTPTPPPTAPQPPPKRKIRRQPRPPKRKIRQIPPRPPIPQPPIPRPITTPAPRPQTVPQPPTTPQPTPRPTRPTPPAPTAPPAPPAPPVDLGPYRRQLGHAIERHKHYPPMAQRMGLEGLVVLLLRVTPKGQLAKPPRIERSSGYGVLDQEAVRMVSAALPLPILPTGFRRPWAEFRIPVRFALEN